MSYLPVSNRLTTRKHSLTHIRGNTLTIEASGILSKDVDDGAYADIVVKYGLITLVKMKVDLCQEGKKIDLNCPLKKGPMKLTKDVDLPQQIPPVCCIQLDKGGSEEGQGTEANTTQGKYTVSANVFTSEDEPVTCLTTTIQFH